MPLLNNSVETTRPMECHGNLVKPKLTQNTCEAVEPNYKTVFMHGINYGSHRFFKKCEINCRYGSVASGPVTTE